MASPVPKRGKKKRGASPPPVARPLPVAQLLIEGFWELHRNFASYLRVSAILLLLVHVTGYLLTWLGIALAAAAGDDAGALASILSFIWIIAAWALYLGVGLVIARLCHRAVILGERPTLRGAFRLSHEFRHYARTAFSVFLVPGLLFVVVYAVAIHRFRGLATSVNWSAGLPYLTLAWIAAAAPRAILALPIAATTSDPDPVRRAIKMSPHNRLRLFAVMALTVLPAALVWLLFHLAHDALTDRLAWAGELRPLGLWAIGYAANLADALLLVPAVAAISSAYVRLAGDLAGRDIAPVSSPASH